MSYSSNSDPSMTGSLFSSSQAERFAAVVIPSAEEKRGTSVIIPASVTLGSVSSEGDSGTSTSIS